MRCSLLSAVALGCLAFGADAQTPSKVGVISVQGAIVGTKDGQKASQELDVKFAPKKKEFDSRQSEMAALQDQYNKGGSVMSEDKRNQLNRDIDEKKKASRTGYSGRTGRTAGRTAAAIAKPGAAHDGCDRKVCQG